MVGAICMSICKKKGKEMDQGSKTCTKRKQEAKGSTYLLSSLPRILLFKLNIASLKCLKPIIFLDRYTQLYNAQ